MHKASFIIFLSMILSGVLRAQEQGSWVTGRLLDDQEQPVMFASTILFNAADSSMVKASYSSEDGTFTIQPVQPGTYYLQTNLVGYEPFTSSSFKVELNKETQLNTFRMNALATALGEVVVTAAKPLVEVKPDKMVFNVEGSVNATGNTALELLRKAPGVIVDHNERLILQGKNGVSVYIDGRQSVLQGEDLANYLKTLQSSQIESIEIITQPSSRYEAAGNAGIINIRLIKDKSLGTNMILSLSHNQAMHGRTNVNGNVNMRQEKLNVFGNLNYAAGANSNWNHFERTTSSQYTVQDNQGSDQWNNISWRAGADLSTGKYSTLGFLADGYNNDEPNQNSIQSTIAAAPGAPLDAILLGTNDVENQRDNYYLNGNYSFDNRDGTVLNVDMDYGQFNNESSSYQPNAYYDPVTGALTEEKNFSSNTLTDIVIKTLKTDYEHPLWKGQLAAGFKLSNVVTANSFEFYDILEGTPVLNPDRTNQFDYTESIYAGYFQYNKQWQNIGIQVGLRAEQTDSKGVLTSLTPENGQTVKQDYLNFFPSGGISWQLNEKNAFNLAFSRRIDRPGYQDLNPFEFKLDELTYQKGNPFLKPQYTNNIQLGHTLGQRLNTSLSFSHTTDLIAPLVDTASNGAAYLTNENIADQDLYVLSISYPFNITKSMNLFVNSSLSHMQNEADFGEGKVIDVSATTYNIYGQATYTLPGQLTLEVSGWYNSPGIWGGNFKTRSIWSMDAGIQKKIWEERATIKLSVSDLFLTNSWSGESFFGDLTMQASGGWESRQLRLNFTYGFGNTNVKESRKRQTGSQEEHNRIR